MRAIPGGLASKVSVEQAYGSTTSTPSGRKIDISIRIQEHLRRYAIDVQDVLARMPSSPFGSDDDDDRPFSPALPSTPPLKKSSDPFILFSPSKKDNIATATTTTMLIEERLL
ncbi:hypothetical protein EC957_011902 [Mortierella hygrophila]|uniref:Uncharacterized protein n=1 Tax=Mortierella hygrophila TaxID=979708 RepID=A0A9P6F748_9FUNG|nr:hypothetical protein EC957_011902 [Mortierella hygrophila]